MKTHKTSHPGASSPTSDHPHTQTHQHHPRTVAQTPKAPTDSYSPPAPAPSAPAVQVGQNTSGVSLPEPTSLEPSAQATQSAKVPVVPTSNTVNVANDTELKAALAAAKPGDNIVLAAGTYEGPLSLQGKTGVMLSGTKDSIINTDNTKKPSLTLDGCNQCAVRGITIKGGQKGLMVLNTQSSVFDGLDVAHTQMEGVHLKNNSSNNTIQHCSVHDIGLGGDTPAGNNRVQSDDGEGIYVGTAKSNNASGDLSNNNAIINNTVYNTTAENIDIKEFTSGGMISGNTLDGAGCGPGAEANVEIKGSGYTVTGNTLRNPYKEGIKTYSVPGVPQSGTNNTVADNMTV